MWWYNDIMNDDTTIRSSEEFRMSLWSDRAGTLGTGKLVTLQIFPISAALNNKFNWICWDLRLSPNSGFHQPSQWILSHFIFLRFFLEVTWWLRDGLETKLSLETSLFFLDLLGHTSYSVFWTTKSIMGCFLMQKLAIKYHSRCNFHNFMKTQLMGNSTWSGHLWLRW